ncbi:hypothetical protein NECID01_0438 [Nematocida sp. AWRm77]|nr:hypothetical protein NECID01_0438 [Nematocida sp. AWRm77]
MSVQSKKVLVGDILYSMIGMNSTSVKVRKPSGFVLSVHESLAQDERRVVNGLMDILIGVREVKYKTEEVYYTKEQTKKALMKGVEAEMEAFFHRVNKVRHLGREKEIEINELLFLFQEDIALFKTIRRLIREMERKEGVFLLQTVMDSEAFWRSSSILQCVLKPTNQALQLLVEGKETAGYFEERNTYGYDECFWTSCYKKKPVPEFLTDKIESLFLLGRLSKLRVHCGEAPVPLEEDVIVQKDQMLYFNEDVLREYYVQLLSSYRVYSMWKEQVAELESVLLLGADRYAAVFSELGERAFCVPTDKEISFVNYLLRRGSAFYSAMEEKMDTQNFSFMAESSFLLGSVEPCKISQLAFVQDSAPLHHMLQSIQKRKIGASAHGVSLLEGLNITFTPKKPLSLFFSTKSLLEVKIVFRLLYSLYAIEHVLCTYPSDWRIRHTVLVFVTNIRMYITEQVKKEMDALSCTADPTQYCAVVEKAFLGIMKASLLTTPALVQFYCKFLSLSFYYIGIEHRVCLTPEETKEILQKYKEMFREALPYVKSSFLYLVFESLAGTL